MQFGEWLTKQIESELIEAKIGTLSVSDGIYLVINLTADATAFAIIDDNAGLTYLNAGSPYWNVLQKIHGSCPSKENLLEKIDPAIFHQRLLEYRAHTAA